MMDEIIDKYCLAKHEITINHLDIISDYISIWHYYITYNMKSPNLFLFIYILFHVPFFYVVQGLEFYKLNFKVILLAL